MREIDIRKYFNFMRNEELKKEITTLECKLDAEKPSMIIPKPKQLAVPIEEVETYRKALEEIREIASAIINGKHITNDIEGHLKELSKSIIEKINEVLK